MRDAVMEALKKTFRPEFLNRVDEYIVFQQLTEDEIGQIVGLMMREVRERMAEHGITVELTEAAGKWLAKEGFDPVFGARPLRRAIQRYVENDLAKRLLAGEFSEGDTVEVDVAKDKLSFKRKASREPAAASA